MQLVMQFIDLDSGFCKSPGSGGGDFVYPPPPAANAIKRRAQQPRPFQPVQQRVQRTRTDAIAVMLQLMHHRKPEDGLVRRMQKHVHTNEPVK